MNIEEVVQEVKDHVRRLKEIDIHNNLANKYVSKGTERDRIWVVDGKEEHTRYRVGDTEFRLAGNDNIVIEDSGSHVVTMHASTLFRIALALHQQGFEQFKKGEAAKDEAVNVVEEMKASRKAVASFYSAYGSRV